MKGKIMHISIKIVGLHFEFQKRFVVEEDRGGVVSVTEDIDLNEGLV